MTRIANHNRAGDQHVQLVIVVLTYGAGDEVADLISVLHKESIDASSELVIVHNPSRSGERLSGIDDARVLELVTNRGYVGGMNAGIELALRRNPELVLLLTHDVRITGHDVRELCALMCDHDQLGALGPVLCTSDSEPYSAGFVRSRRVRMQHRVPAGGMPRPVWQCAAIDGSAMMWRATALEGVRGFDERFFMYFDDVDICTRAIRCGWQVGVATDLRAISAPGKSSRRRAHAYLRARNGLAYARTFGFTGLLAGLGMSVAGLWQVTPKPGGQRFRDPEMRKLAASYWGATLLGMADYFRGRWGPPPPPMLRDSDIAATSMRLPAEPEVN
jgi:N-acetylglucosaminyl-diphospho-decaprenol L-rhamnosyltransferase